MANFEDEYLDVLQNIESAIVGVYRQNPEMVDYDIEKALNSLLSEYQRPSPGSSRLNLSPSAKSVYEKVKQMCEWRLGKQEMTKAKGHAKLTPEPLSVDEIIACLKRVRKSVQKWNKEGGRRGYLTFIDQFIV